MKLLIYLIIFFLFVLCPALVSQPTEKEWEEYQDILNYTIFQLDASRDSVRILKKTSVKQDSVINELKFITKKDSNQIVNLNRQLELLKNEVTKVELPPIIKFSGFYANLIADYKFDSLVITKTILQHLNYAISGEFVFDIVSKIKIGLEAIIPFSDRFKIQLKAGYRLF